MTRKHAQLGVTEMRHVCRNCKSGWCSACVDSYRQRYSSTRVCSCGRDDHGKYVTAPGTKPRYRVEGIP